MDSKKTIRLDARVSQVYPEYSRKAIQSWIKEGLICVDGKPLGRPGALVHSESRIECTIPSIPYVSRAGLKLAHALAYFNIDVEGLVVMDAGLSTGGFADCLLKQKALTVFGIDVGHSQLHESLKNNPHLIVMEKTNLKEVTMLPQPIDMITLDLSFISIGKVMANVSALLSSGGKFVALIKPQFESGIEHRGKKGVITDSKVHALIIKKVMEEITGYGFVPQGVIESPLLGGSGNKEFIAYFIKQ